MTPNATKNMWRAQMLETRSQIGPEKVSQFNRDLNKNLSFVWVEAGKGDIANRPFWVGYKSFNWEADPQQAILEAQPFIKWIFPKVLPDLTLEFYEPKPATSVGLSQGGTRWLKNSWGIWEPDPETSEKVDLNLCVGVLVPGVAFDRSGHRLGYGKGFYDRALANFKGLKVGVGFSMQVTSETLPFDPTDIAMDLVVTDRDIIRIPKADRKGA
jgi:5,10-methenyltetrahydrofolate synthetase